MGQFLRAHAVIAPVITTNLSQVSALAGPLYVVTGVLLVAGLAKITTPSPTATALRILRIPAPLVAARLLGAAEVVLAVAAVAFGAPVLWALVAAAYAGFTVFVLWALQADEAVGSCGCFGQEDTPPTPGHAAFNAAGAALAALAIADPVRLGDFDGSAVEGVLLAALTVAGVALSVLAMTRLPRLLALVHGTAAPVVPTFGITDSASKGTQ
jgi:hypothetical protein